MATNPFLSGSEVNLRSALATPLPAIANTESSSLLADIDDALLPPNPRRFSSLGGPAPGVETPRDSVLSATPSHVPLTGAAAAAGIAGAADEMNANSGDNALNEKAEGTAAVSGAAARRRKWLWIGGAIALIVVAAAVAVPVGVIFGTKNKSSSDIGSGSGSGSGSGGSGSNGGSGGSNGKGATSGGNGSTVTTEDGSTFTYINPFGGIWVSDPTSPFDNSAYPNSWTPPLNTSWTWGVDRVYGVNLGGWFVLEPFIVPSLFQKYSSATPTVIDEWTLSQAMVAAGDTTLSEIENHYATFITEEDIAQIAGAGLNWIRVPIPFWAIDKWDTTSDSEPFLARTCWTYILRLFRWARKYGLRVNLDLHTAPGSQNGYNHSGKDGQVNMLFGPMGFANAQRMLNYIRIIAEFIAQEEYQNLIPMYGIINEALIKQIGKDVMTNFYVQAYDIIRSITGTGEGKGPFISIHDGFNSLDSWADFLPGADRIALDTHPYFAFNGQPNTDPIGVWPARACDGWAASVNASQTAFGVTLAGEFSNGINDCGLFVNGVGGGHSYGGDCNFWMDSTQWNETIVDGLHEFMLASMDALQNWFFWTWKIGNSSDTNTVQAPLWSYQLGLQGGWMPTDPRSAVGACASLDVSPVSTFSGTYSAWQTGGAGAGTIEPDVLASFTAWPPATISGVDGDVGLVYTYTATASVETLPPDVFTVTEGKATTTSSGGDGWADSADTALGVTEVAGCSYLDPWSANGSPVQTALCTGPTAAARLRRSAETTGAVEAKITEPPSAV